MSTTRDWGIVYHGRREPNVRTTSAHEMRALRSTGLFDVPNGEAAQIDLNIYLSSFAPASREVDVVVNQLVGTERRRIFSRSLRLPSGEARRLEVGDVAGKTLEVTVAAADDVVPSAAATQVFLADGGILVRVYKSPADFVRV